ncbi:MAG TPA: dienelactone hydrolase family protein [Sphingomonadaceae bacterium]|nr:dienelactone hydrolase family protein [Sphingomonadaceae bacterium]
MAIETRPVRYEGPGGPFEGVLAWDTAAEAPHPGVMVAPNVLGLKAFDVEKAKALAALGYVGFAIDVYGAQNRPEANREHARALMQEAEADRRVLQARMTAALDALRAQPEADATRIGAIGFCFGGKCVLDLARSGADVAGVVSLHGVFDAPPFANAAPISARILVLHGFDDPLAGPEASVALGRELTASGADWQIHLYGHAAHGFTAPGSAAPGIGYDEKADRRSWRALCDFFEELWG